ncbi:MAG: leucyl aminopeptidase [Desulfobacterales bacterium]|nr:leucyl aminopeptidase [Desulfobacterales bacterium]
MIELKYIDVKKEKLKVLIIPVCEDKDIFEDDIISPLIAKAKEIKEFKGKKDEELIFYGYPGINAERIIFKGIGENDKISTEVLRSFAGGVVKKNIKNKFSEVYIEVPTQNLTKIQKDELLESLMEGAYLGNYIFDGYKQKKDNDKIPLKKICFIANIDTIAQYAYLPDKIKTICDGTFLARNWVNIPSNLKKPEQFTQSIIDIAEKENIKATVFSGKILEQKGFGGIVAVASGSVCEPSMVILEYMPEKAKKTIALIGKGVTFDSGGISLKSQSGLEDMKIDMAGAAASAAAIFTASKLKLNANVISIIPIVENMPSGTATRPGDVIKSYDGKTVEILNTDAEGRLILMDAMSYAVQIYKPDILIDIATLTGSCMAALGTKIAGLFSLDDELASKIIKAGERTNELCWRLPLPDFYKDQLKSEIADIKNVSDDKYGGAITAALFLLEFVGDTKWAHLDIAGPASTKKDESYYSFGGTGFGVRLFIKFIEDFISEIS